MDTLALIASVVGSSIAATWVLRTKLSDIEGAMKTHIASDEHEFGQLTGRVVKLERRKAR